MRKLAIAYGNSRQAKKWVNKEITFDALKDRLKTPIRTTESAEEYAKFSKGQKDIAKELNLTQNEVSERLLYLMEEVKTVFNNG